ncbi:HD domain-containing protein [Methyloparacoccus murrellii]
MVDEPEAGLRPPSGHAGREPSPRRQSTGIRADLRQIIYALSDTLDLVGVDDVTGGKRVAIIAAECGKQAGLDQHDITFLFDVGLLRDIGVSSTHVHAHLLQEFDWEGVQEHCELGAALLRQVRPLAALAEPVRLHHTRWDRLQQMSLPQRTREQANRIFLADRVNMLAAPYYADRQFLLRHAFAIREAVTARVNTYFSPRLVVDFLAVSAPESFWLNLEPQSVHLYLGQMLKQSAPIMTPMRELRCLAHVFSRIVDAKSPYMTGHSQGVSQLARWLAEHHHLDAETCDKIEIAGLLHDLGKLRIPDEIIEKPGPLDEFERHIMKTHSFETFQILRRVAGFDEIRDWIAYDLERPATSREPFRPQREQLVLEARIMRVADVFQAMMQDRPFRKALPPEHAGTLLEEMAQKGELDGEIVALVLADLPGAMSAAKATDHPTRH